LREDAALEMPPLVTWFSGREAVRRFFTRSPMFDVPGRFRLVPVMANGQAAFAAYLREGDGPFHADAVLMPTVTTTGIARIDIFLDTGLFPAFGLPPEYGGAAAGPA